MLAHGINLWPQAVSKSLWPFAIKAACRARNHFKLDNEGLSPIMKLSGIRTKMELRNEHPLFCPVYTLDKNLQSGPGMIPKWNPRSNAGMYLGHSPEHASNVALVMNLTTGMISPQYHVVFDDTFSTVGHITTRQEPHHWSDLCKYHSEDYQMVPSVTKHLNDFGTEIKWLGDLSKSQPARTDRQSDNPNSQNPANHDSSDPRSREGEDMPDLNPTIADIALRDNTPDSDKIWQTPNNDTIPASEGATLDNEEREFDSQPRD